jgi:hypothetical protein
LCKNPLKAFSNEVLPQEFVARSFAAAANNQIDCRLDEYQVKFVVNAIGSDGNDKIKETEQKEKSFFRDFVSRLSETLNNKKTNSKLAR